MTEAQEMRTAVGERTLTFCKEKLKKYETDLKVLQERGYLNLFP